MGRPENVPGREQFLPLLHIDAKAVQQLALHRVRFVCGCWDHNPGPARVTSCKMGTFVDRLSKGRIYSETDSNIIESSARSHPHRVLGGNEAAARVRNKNVRGAG